MKDSTPIPGVEGQLPHFMMNRGAARSPSINVTLTRARLGQVSDDRGTTGELFGKTLTGERDTAHRVVPYRNPSHLPQNKPRDGSRWLPVTNCSVLYELGLGLCGFSNICHGGVEATLLDGVSGLLMVINGRA